MLLYRASTQDFAISMHMIVQPPQHLLDADSNNFNTVLIEAQMRIADIGHILGYKSIAVFSL